MRKALTTVLTGTALLLVAAGSLAAPPTLGSNCGAGATIVGSDAAGKLTLGAGASDTSRCTLTFSVAGANAPACSGVNETNGGGWATPVGTKSSPTTVVLSQNSYWS